MSYIIYTARGFISQSSVKISIIDIQQRLLSRKEKKMNVQSVSAVGFYGIGATRKAGNNLRDKQSAFIEQVCNKIIPERVNALKAQIQSLNAQINMLKDTHTDDPKMAQAIKNEIEKLESDVKGLEQRLEDAPEKARKIFYSGIGNH